MWKITHIRLENVSYLWSGLHKNIVDINFTKANENSKLNMIIGPMGSGKSVILGHLQPFSSFGTLDSRNSESMILPEVDGHKIIEYLHDGHEYIINHDYIWNKTTKSHGVKSYIAKDGVELNPNGNSGSFKEVIKMEFGIDQSFLRVLRLGPNVANVINMKAVERKKFIASLQEDTELYLMIYKKLSDDYRVIKASITSVSNRLMQLSSTKADEMKAELEALLEEQETVLHRIDQYKAEIAKLHGMNETLGGGSSEKLLDAIDDAVRKEDELKSIIDQLTADLDDINSANETPESISVKIGAMRATTTSLEKTAFTLSTDLQELEAEINRLHDMLETHKSDVHLAEMREVLSGLEKEYNRAMISLSGFDCKYGYEFLAKFIDDLSVLRSQIEECGQFEPKTIQFLLSNADKSIGPIITKKIDMLTGRKVNVQKAISNIKFSAEYVPQFQLFRDPRCTSDECPYFTTHPVTVNKKIGKPKDREAALLRYQDEIDQLDVEIAKWQELPMQQRQIQLLLNMWKSSFPILVELGVVSQSLRLYDLLTDQSLRQDWYHYQQLVTILEKCKLQSEYNEIAARYAKTKNEIAILESPEYEGNAKRYQELVAKQDGLKAKLEDVRKEYTDSVGLVDKYELLYTKVQKRKKLESDLHTAQDSLTSTHDELDKMRSNLELIKANNHKIHELENEVMGLSIKYKEFSTKTERLKTVLSQIEYSQQEYQDLLEQSQVMKAVLDAVSAKNGIPLILVRHFLNDCRGIVNDLIAEVFDDDLEILDFDVTEDDFKIPYMINGQTISDISYASQGQQSIISIALSFALVRQSMFDYNIMLLDEIDGPLHKNDREKFIGILFRQMAAIQADQVFLISHNSTFEGNPVNLIMTADEDVEPSTRQVVIRV